MFKNEEIVIHILSLSIVLSVVISSLFLVILFIRRYKKIQDEKIIIAYIPIIDAIIFPMLFNNKPIQVIIESNDYTIYAKHKKFRRILLQTIIRLHTNYSGEYNLKLEEFYRDSGLINISKDKLKSNFWSSKCEGIRELSEMSAHESFSDIHALIHHKNSTLKLEALIGIIRLKGIIGIAILNDYHKPINDWIQLNLIYEINKTQHTSVYNFSEFLVSKNESLVLLGLRLISNFNQVQDIEEVRNLIGSSKSNRIKEKAEQTYVKLSSLTFKY